MAQLMFQSANRELARFGNFVVTEHGIIGQDLLANLALYDIHRALLFAYTRFHHPMPERVGDVGLN